MTFSDAETCSAERGTWLGLVTQPDGLGKKRPSREKERSVDDKVTIKLFVTAIAANLPSPLKTALNQSSGSAKS